MLFFMARGIAPITGKEVIRYDDWYASSAAVTMQGKRLTDEDAVLLLSPLQNFPSCRMSCVFDGHNGHWTSIRLAHAMPNLIGSLPNVEQDTIRDAFLRLDQEILESWHRENGSTAVIVIIEHVRTRRRKFSSAVTSIDLTHHPASPLDPSSPTTAVRTSSTSSSTSSTSSSSQSVLPLEKFESRLQRNLRSSVATDTTIPNACSSSSSSSTADKVPPTLTSRDTDVEANPPPADPASPSVKSPVPLSHGDPPDDSDSTSRRAVNAPSYSAVVEGACNGPCSASSDDSEYETLFNLTVCNVGDSRALLLRTSGKWCALTRDHHPAEPSERERIENAGGKVMAGRINAQMAVSRAFGDSQYKQQKRLNPDQQLVISVPDLRVLDASPGDLIVIACDGLFETFTNKQLMNFVWRRLQQPNFDIAECATELVDQALIDGSMDNMTVQIIQLRDTQASPLALVEKYIPAIIFGRSLNSNKRFERSLYAEYQRVGVNEKAAMAAAVKAPDWGFWSKSSLSAFLVDQRSRPRMIVPRCRPVLPSGDRHVFLPYLDVPHFRPPQEAITTGPERPTYNSAVSLRTSLARADSTGVLSTLHNAHGLGPSSAAAAAAPSLERRFTSPIPFLSENPPGNSAASFSSSTQPAACEMKRLDMAAAASTPVNPTESRPNEAYLLCAEPPSTSPPTHQNPTGGHSADRQSSLPWLRGTSSRRSVGRSSSESSLSSQKSLVSNTVKSRRSSCTIFDSAFSNFSFRNPFFLRSHKRTSSLHGVSSSGLKRKASVQPELSRSSSCPHNLSPPLFSSLQASPVSHSNPHSRHDTAHERHHNTPKSLAQLASSQTSLTLVKRQKPNDDSPPKPSLRRFASWEFADNDAQPFQSPRNLISNSLTPITATPSSDGSRIDQRRQGSSSNNFPMSDALAGHVMSGLSCVVQSIPRGTTTSSGVNLLDNSRSPPRGGEDDDDDGASAENRQTTNRPLRSGGRGPSSAGVAVAMHVGDMREWRESSHEAAKCCLDMPVDVAPPPAVTEAQVDSSVAGGNTGFGDALGSLMKSVEVSDERLGSRVEEDERSLLVCEGSGQGTKRVRGVVNLHTEKTVQKGFLADSVEMLFEEDEEVKVKKTCCVANGTRYAVLSDAGDVGTCTKVVKGPLGQKEERGDVVVDREEEVRIASTSNPTSGEVAACGAVDDEQAESRGSGCFAEAGIDSTAEEEEEEEEQRVGVEVAENSSGILGGAAVEVDEAVAAAGSTCDTVERFMR